MATVGIAGSMKPEAAMTREILFQRGTVEIYAAFEYVESDGQSRRCGLRFLPFAPGITAAHSGLNWRRLAIMQAVIRSRSGTNSPHSRIASGAHRAAGSAACAETRDTPTTTSKLIASPAAEQRCEFFIMTSPQIEI